MTMDEVNELKRRLVETTDFSAFQNYFFTNFVEQENFKTLGRVLAAPRARGLMQMIGEAYEASGAKGRFRLSGNLIEIPEVGLIHGAFLLDGKVAAVVYFPDIAMGMCSVSNGLLSGKTTFLRFGGQLPTNSKPS